METSVRLTPVLEDVRIVGVQQWTQGGFLITHEDLREYLQPFRRSRDDLVMAITDLESGLHIRNVTLNDVNWFTAPQTPAS